MKELPNPNKSTGESYMYRPRKVYAHGLPFHKRAINRIEKLNKILFLRFLGKILRVHHLHTPIDLSKVSSVLFIRYDALGDMVVTTPLWRILKRAKPSIKIGVAGSSKNLGIIRGDSDIDVIYDYSASSLKEFRALSAITRQQKWDVVFMCKFNQKTRGGIISRLATSDGYNVTIGNPNAEGHQALFSRLVPLPKPAQQMPMTEQLQYLLTSTIVLPKTSVEAPSLSITKQIESDTHKRTNAILSSDATSEYILINTDAPDVRKWGLQNNMQLAQFISDSYPNYSVLLSSLPQNKVEIEEAIGTHQIARAHYFQTSGLQELVGVVRFASLVVTPDTGVAHVAAAEKKPILGFYPEAGEWLPYKVRAYIILPKPGDLIASIPIAAAISGLVHMLGDSTAGQNSGQIIKQL